MLLPLCVGNPPVTGGFPTQKDSNVENTFIWWCHNVSLSNKYLSYSSIMYINKLHIPVLYIFEMIAINMPADVIAPNGARLSAATMLTFQSDVFPGKFLF